MCVCVCIQAHQLSGLLSYQILLLIKKKCWIDPSIWVIFCYLHPINLSQAMSHGFPKFIYKSKKDEKAKVVENNTKLSQRRMKRLRVVENNKKLINCINLQTPHFLKTWQKDSCPSANSITQKGNYDTIRIRSSTYEPKKDEMAKVVENNTKLIDCICLQTHIS